MILLLLLLVLVRLQLPRLRLHLLHLPVQWLGPRIRGFLLLLKLQKHSCEQNTRKNRHVHRQHQNWPLDLLIILIVIAAIIEINTIINSTSITQASLGSNLVYLLHSTAFVPCSSTTEKEEWREGVSI
jgi:hypothetical protein